MYLQIDKQIFATDLKGHVVEVLFDLPPDWILPEGQTHRRTMSCTLIPDFLPTRFKNHAAIDEHLVRAPGPNAIYVYDVHQRRPVTLMLDRIISAQVKQTY